MTLWEISAVITTAVCPFAGAVMGTMTVEMDLMRETVNPDLALRVSIAVTTSSAFQDLGFVTMTMTVGTILTSGTASCGPAVLGHSSVHLDTASQKL